jgi:hypothetical protein
MTQPSFVPITRADQVRNALRLEVPRPWVADRPAEVRVPGQPQGPAMGTPGPDQGYALHLARRFEDRLHLRKDESPEDVVLGCALLASRRAALVGRAPSVHDVRVALTLWGFLDESAPADLVEERAKAFRSVSHDYVVQRQLVDRVPESTLLLTPAAVTDRVGSGDWRSLLGA